LLNGAKKHRVTDQRGSAAGADAVATERFATGYSGIGYKPSAVRAVPLAKPAKSKAIEATAENVYADEYPLARYLYLTLNYKPNSELEPLRREFLKYVFSKDGQEIVIKQGYFPVTAAVREKSLKSVGIDPKK